jgi:hypothetical protein
VPVRAIGKGGGLCSGRATAAARWRPAGCTGRRVKARRHQRGQRRAVGSNRATRGQSSWRRWPPGRSTAVGAAPLSAGGVEQRASRLEEGDKDPNIISEIPGTPL